MNPKLIPFEWPHFDSLKLRPYDKAMFEAVPDGKAQLQRYLDNGSVYTGVIGNEIIMIGGISVDIPHYGFVWLLTSTLTSRYKLFFFKSCKHFIELSIKHFNLTDIETTVLNADKISHAWVKRLGFEIDRQEHRFGLDYSVYTRVI